MTFRRAGFVATLAAGTLMIASAVHGVAGVDTTLQIAAARQPAVQPLPVAVVHHHHDCDRPDRPEI